MAIIKSIKRTVRFDTRELGSKYRCRYGNRNDFDILRVNIEFEEEIRETYEVEARYLPETDSIHFKAKPAPKGFEVYGWTAVVAPYIRKVEI